MTSTILIGHTIKLQWRESSRWLTKSTPSSDHRWETPLCALSSCQRSTVEYRAPNSMYLSSFFVTLKLLQVNATMTCELREKKSCQQRVGRWEWWRVELVTRTSAFIHDVILLHKYIELPILYKYFGIFYCESEIKYSENVYSKIMSQGQKRPHNSSDCSICHLDFTNFRGGPPDPPSGAASLRSPAATVPATSTSFLIFRGVDLPLYAFSYLAPLGKTQETCSNNALIAVSKITYRVRNTAMWKWLCLFRVDCCAVSISMYSIQACQLILFKNGPQQLDFYFCSVHSKETTWD